MITFTIKDKGKLVASLVKRNSKFKQDVKRNFIIAGDQFIQYIRGRWYEGRNAEDTGLNRVTGDLWRNWIANAREEGIDVVATISNKMGYGKKHEEGKGIKRRTFVTQDITNPYSTKLFREAAGSALKANF